MKTLQQFVSEGLSSILFHRTEVHRVISMLKSDRIYGTALVPSGSDIVKGAKPEKLWYLSTSRSIRSGYVKRVGPFSVILVLDGNKLSQRYYGTPYDYWYVKSDHEISPATRTLQDEMEDRVWFDNEYIPNASKYIKKIYVYIPAEKDNFLGSDWNSAALSRLRKLWILAKRKNIPLLVFDTEAELFSQRESKALHVDQVPGIESKNKRTPGPYIEIDTTSSINHMLELWHTPNRNMKMLSSKAYSMLHDIMYRDYVWDDIIRRTRNEIHNSRSDLYRNEPNNKHVVAFLKIMRQLKVIKIKDVLEAIKTKWQPDMEQ